MAGVAYWASQRSPFPPRVEEHQRRTPDNCRVGFSEIFLRSWFPSINDSSLLGSSWIVCLDTLMIFWLTPYNPVFDLSCLNFQTDSSIARKKRMQGSQI